MKSTDINKKRDRVKRLVIWLLVLGLLLPVIASISYLLAVDQKEVDAAKKKLDSIRRERSQVSAQLKNIKNSLSSELEQKELLDRQIVLADEEIALLEEEILQTQAKIDENEGRITELDARKDELYTVFKQRLRVVYEEGEISYLAVLLNADSIEDFLNRMDLVGSILGRDKEIIGGIEEVCDEIRETTGALEEAREESRTLLSELENGKKELEAALAESEAVMKRLRGQQAEKEKLYEKYDKQEDEAEAEERRLTKELQEKLKKEQEAQNKKPPVVTGYIWPLKGYTKITSNYGYRTHPVTGKKNSFHTGIDIGAPSGTPVYAIAAGTVLQNKYNSAYGYMVTIDHGNGIVSLYGHFRKLSALKVGQTVTQGQVIGYVGSTGLSTGPHLHLTIYKNGDLADPKNYVSP